MMYFLCSAPPQTLGTVRPASRATSTNWTGEAAGESEADGIGRVAASRRIVPRHFQSGVASASNSELPRTIKDEPRNRRRNRFIVSDHRWRKLPSRYLANEPIRLRSVFGCLFSFTWHLGKIARHNSRAFLDGDDLVDGHTRQLICLPARPSDFERFDLRALAQAKMNSRIAGRHVAHAAFGLFDVGDAFGGEIQRRANSIAIGFCTNEQNFQPMIGVAAIVAKKLRIVTAIIDGDVDVPVVVEISHGQAPASDGADEVWA